MLLWSMGEQYVSGYRGGVKEMYILAKVDILTGKVCEWNRL